MYGPNSVQTSAAEAVQTTFTMAGYPAGHGATLTSTGSCHLLGGSEDSSVHWGEFHEEVVVLSMHSVQIRWETVACWNLSIKLCNYGKVCERYKISHIL